MYDNVKTGLEYKLVTFTCVLNIFHPKCKTDHLIFADDAKL